jgi:mono/diheme cytochrome c family protein
MIEALYGLLKNLGYEHPIHSPLAHMPIGLATGALVFFLVAIIFKRKALAISARNVSILALAFALPTILFGVFDWIHFYHGVLFPAIRIKMGLAAALLVILGAGIVLGSEVKPKVVLMTSVYVLAFAAVLGLGYFGGTIVYGQGAIGAQADIIGLSGAPASEAAKAGAASEAPPAGRAIFEANCAACHAGGGNSIVSSLPVRGSKRLGSLESFEEFVRAPTMPNGKVGDMPPFPEDALSEAQVKTLYDYAIASFEK